MSEKWAPGSRRTTPRVAGARPVPFHRVSAFAHEPVALRPGPLAAPLFISKTEVITALCEFPVAVGTRFHKPGA